MVGQDDRSWRAYRVYPLRRTDTVRLPDLMDGQTQNALAFLLVFGWPVLIGYPAMIIADRWRNRPGYYDGRSIEDIRKNSRAK